MDIKAFKFHQGWIYFLTTAWLIATFEHNYFTLSKYSHDAMLLDWIPISDISAFLIVLALDLSIFWSIMFIPQAKIWNVSLMGARITLIVSTLISILLNVRYMWTASPSPEWFDIMIGVLIGVLIPIYVVIFGWIAGNVATIQSSNIDKKINRATNNGRVLEVDELISWMRDNPKASQRDASKHFNVSLSTIQNRLREYK